MVDKNAPIPALRRVLCAVCCVLYVVCRVSCVSRVACRVSRVACRVFCGRSLVERQQLQSR